MPSRISVSIPSSIKGSLSQAIDCLIGNIL
jgi:hypothetical protein